MIDYTVDIAEGMFHLIASDPNYQVPGNFRLQPTWATLTPGKKRLLVFIELLRCYFAAMENTTEANLMQAVTAKIMLSIKLAQRLNGENGARAQARAMHYIAGQFRSNRPLSRLLLEDDSHLNLEDSADMIFEREIDN